MQRSLTLILFLDPSFQCIQLLISTGIIGTQVVAQITPWPQFRLSASRSGQSRYQGPTKQPSLLWSYATGDEVSSSPCLGSDGTVFIGSHDATFYALDGSSGSVKWSYTPPVHFLIYSSPMVDSFGTVYIAMYWYFAAFDGSDGTEQWIYENNNGMPSTNFDQSSPVLSDDGTIYIGADPGYLLAFDDAGSLKWNVSIDSQEQEMTCSPAIGTDGTIFFATEIFIIGVDPEGTVKWTNVSYGKINGALAVGSDNTVYYGVNTGGIYALDGNTGFYKWHYNTDSIFMSAAIADDNTVYFATGFDYGTLYALNGNDGSLKWSYSLGGTSSSSPAIGSDGTVYIGCDDGNMYAIDSNGNLLWTFKAGGAIQSSPAIGSDGQLYFGANDNSVYAIQ